MSGMNTTTTTDLSNYNSRTIEIEVTGLHCQDISRTTSYRVKVPYSRMSQEMQRINRMGGKIASVTVVSLLLGEVTAAQDVLNAGISTLATYYHVNEAVAVEHSAESQSAEPVIDPPVNEAVAIEHSAESQSAEPVTDPPVNEAVAVEHLAAAQSAESVINTHVNEVVAVEHLEEAQSAESVIHTHVNEAVAVEHSAESQSVEPVIDPPVNEAVAVEHLEEAQSAEPVINTHVNEAVAAKTSSNSEKIKAKTKAFQPSKTNSSKSKRKPKS